MHRSETLPEYTPGPRQSDEPCKIQYTFKVINNLLQQLWPHDSGRSNFLFEAFLVYLGVWEKETKRKCRRKGGSEKRST